MRGFLALGLIVVLGACAGPPPEPGPIVTSPDVSIETMSFLPAVVTIQTGDTVTWHWNDGEIQHDVLGDGFESEVKIAGTFVHMFPSPGTFTYTCSLHGNMKGTVFVLAP